MKSSKKILSVVLAILMIMTSVTCAFTSFAAAKGVSEAQWNELVEAIKNDTIQNKINFDGKSTIVDPDGSVIKLADAYWAVLGGLYDTADQNSSTRTISQVENTILNNLQSRLDVTTYKAASILRTLTNSTNASSSTNQTSQHNAPTVTLTVKPAENYIIPGSSVADIPVKMVTGKTYTVTHTNKSYQQKNGCKTTTYYYLVIDKLTTKDTSTIERATYEAYQEAFVKYENEGLFDKDLKAIFDMGSDAVTTAKNELQTAYNAIPANILAQFFSEYAAKVNAIVPVLETAKSALDTNATVVAAINSEVKASASKTERADLVASQTAIKTNLASYNSKAADVKAFLEANGYIDIAAVNTALETIQFKIDVIDVQAIVDSMDAVMENAAKYDSYTAEAAANGDYNTESADITLASVALNNQYKALASIVTSNEKAVIEVLGADYNTYFEAVQTRASHVKEIAGLTDFNADLNKFVEDLEANYKDDAEKTENQNLIAKHSYYVDLLAKFNNEAAALPEGADPVLAQVVIDHAKANVVKTIAECEAAINATVKAQLGEAKTLAEALADDFGGEVTMASINTVKALKDAIGNFDVELYNYAVSTALVGDEEIDLYAKMNANNIVEKYNEFVANGGFDKFETTDLADVVRHENEAEVIREGDYAVTDEKATAIVGLLDKLLASDEFKDLTGISLADVINPSLLNKLYTDELINTVMQFIYPLVAKEFAKVWADLPTNVEADNPIGSGKLDVALTLYKIEEAMTSIHFPIFPTLLAKELKDSYPQVAEVLAKSTTKAVYHKDTDIMDNPWEDAAICTEEGKLNLNWGVNEAAPEDKEEAFLNAAQAALTGLEPILLALLSNQTIDGTHHDNCNDIAKDGQPGHGKVGTGKTSIKVLITISVTVDPINLFLNISGNEGYNNALVPIFEALGLDAQYIPDGNKFTSTKQVLKEGLLEPVKALLAQFAEAPVTFLAKALPNLAYGVEAGRIVPLLQMLKTDITYHADAHYNAVAGLASGDINEALKDGPITINVGDMLDLGSLGLDLSSLNGLLSLVTGLLGDITLPQIDGTTLATLGKLVEKDTKRGAKTYTWGTEGKAAYIEANQGDVLVFVLKYLLKAIASDDTLIPTIVELIGSINKDEAETPDVEAPEEKEPFVLPELVNVILANVMANEDDALAAITEAVFPKEYAPANGDINWVKPEDRGEANEITYPTEAWTKEKAQYIVDNFPTVVDNIIKIAGVKVGDSEMLKNLPEVLDELLGTLYTAENVNKLADLISGLLSGLDPKLASLIGSLLEIDLTYWDTFEATFEGNNREAFVDAMVDLLAPLKDVLKFIVAGDNLVGKITTADGRVQLVELQGYESYSNGIIPLVEALGSTNVKTPAELQANKDNIARIVIEELVSAIDNLTADPYNKLLDLVMNVVYFVASNGATVVIDNVLHGVEAVLEVIRPIYPTNISELVGMDIKFAEQDLISFLLSLANKAVKEKFGIEIFQDFTASSLLRDLSFGDIEAFQSANGKTAYRMTGASKDAADLLTVVGRYAITQLVFSENATAYADLAKAAFELDDRTYEFLKVMLSSLAKIENGPDYALGVVFYIFFGANTAVDAVNDYYKYYAYDWVAIIKEMNRSDISYLQKASYVVKEVYEKTACTIIDDLDLPINSEDINGYVNIFQRIISAVQELFKNIADFFKGIGK